MSKNIDIRGIFGALLQISTLKIGLVEIRILLYLIGKTGMIPGKKIPKNIKEISRDLKIDRTSIRRAIKGLEEKNILEVTGNYLSLFANPNRKDEEGRVVQTPSLYFTQFLAKVKGIDNVEWGELPPFMDTDLDLGFFDRFFADERQNNAMSMEQIPPISNPPTPYILKKRKTGISNEIPSDQISPSTRHFQKASSNDDSEKTEEKPPRKKSLMTPEMIVDFRKTGVIDIGIFTELVINAFIELDEPMSIGRINGEIKPWAMELGRAYQASDHLQWAQQIIFTWKTYYSQEKNREKMTDAKTSLSLFFANAKKPK